MYLLYQDYIFKLRFLALKKNCFYHATAKIKKKCWIASVEQESDHPGIEPGFSLPRKESIPLA